MKWSQVRGCSCFRSQGFVLSLAWFVFTVALEVMSFVLSVAFEGSGFVLSLAKEGANCATPNGISTGKVNDLKENDLKHWFSR